MPITNLEGEVERVDFQDLYIAITTSDGISHRIDYDPGPNGVNYRQFVGSTGRYVNCVIEDGMVKELVELDNSEKG